MFHTGKRPAVIFFLQGNFTGCKLQNGPVKNCTRQATDHFDLRCSVVIVAGHLVWAAGEDDGDRRRTHLAEVGAQSVVGDAADRQSVDAGHVAVTTAVVSHWPAVARRPHVDRTLTTTPLRQTHTQNITLSTGTRQQSSPVSLTELHGGSGRLLRVIKRAKTSWTETRAPTSWVISTTNQCSPCGRLVSREQSFQRRHQLLLKRQCMYPLGRGPAYSGPIRWGLWNVNNCD